MSGERMPSIIDFVCLLPLENTRKKDFASNANCKHKDCSEHG